MKQSSLLSRDRELLRTVFLSTFLFGLAAHGYGFLNFTISHDAMNEFYSGHAIGYYAGTAAQWKIALGRFLCPVYFLLFRGETVSPWFSGMLALFWTALAVWAAAHVFEIRRTPLLILVSGIFTVNLSMTALTASYLHDLDADMLAVLTAVCAVLCWKQGKKIQLAAIPLLLVTLGIYQSMLSVYIALVMFVCILRLRENDAVLTVILDGLRSILLMGAAAVLYLVCSKAAVSLSGLALTNQENGIANMLSEGSGFLFLLTTTYRSWIESFLFTVPRINILWNVLLFLGCLAVLPEILLDRTLRPVNKLLMLLLMLLLPLGMNISAFLNNGIVHTLMMYASTLIFLLIFLLTRRKPRIHTACLILAGLLLFSNIRFSNSLYVRKDIERQAALSTMTRVVDRLEQTEGYVPGETPVCILGTPGSQLPGFSRTYEVVGSLLPSPITTPDFYDAYFTYVLQYPIRLCDPQTYAQIAASCADLASFPAENCTTWLGGTLVIKLSTAD